jgi:hypothetical protein
MLRELFGNIVDNAKNGKKELNLPMIGGELKLKKKKEVEPKGKKKGDAYMMYFSKKF